MVRTNLQLDPDIREALRRRAFEERKSVSAVAREILRKALRVPPAEKARGKDRYNWSFIGMLKGQPPDVAENHDHYLNEGDRW